MRKQFSGVVSIAIPLLLLVLILNFFSGFIPMENIQGLPVILPIFLCPIGAVIGFVSYRLYKDKWSLIGIVFNIVMFFVSDIVSRYRNSHFWRVEELRSYDDS